MRELCVEKADERERKNERLKKIGGPMVWLFLDLFARNGLFRWIHVDSHCARTKGRIISVRKLFTTFLFSLSAHFVDFEAYNFIFLARQLT